MMYSKISKKIFYGAAAMTAGVMLILTSCTERYFESSGNGNVLTSMVDVPIEWSNASADTAGLVAANMKYLFIPSQTETSATSTASGLSYVGFYSHFRGTLPVGSYSLLVYTSGIAGLTPVNDIQFEKAAVHAAPVHPAETGSTPDSEYFIAPCGRFWAASLEKTDVPATPVTTAAIHPRAFTSQIRLHIVNNAGLSIDSISGIFRGLVTSRLLCSGQPDTPTVRGAYGFGCTPSGTTMPNTEFTSVFRTLGVYDPLSAEQPYSNVLTLTAWLNYGKHIVTHVDVSEKIHDALALVNAGTGSGLDTAIELTIILNTVTGNEITATVSVKAWENGGEIWQDI